MLMTAVPKHVSCTAYIESQIETVIVEMRSPLRTSAVLRVFAALWCLHAATVSGAPTVQVSSSSLQFLAPVQFTLTFNTAVSGCCAANKLLLSGTANPRSAVVSAVSTTVYRVAVSGMNDTGSVVLDVAAGAAQDASTSVPSLASSTTASGREVIYVPELTVSVSHGADPTTASPVPFTVQFSAAVVGFDTNSAGSRLLVGGTALPSSLVTIVANPNDASSYTVFVSGMQSPGTVTLDIPAGVASQADLPSILNQPSATTGAGRSLQYILSNWISILTPPESSANPLSFWLIFQVGVSGVDPSAFAVSSTINAQLQSVQTFNSSAYRVFVNGMTGIGAVTLTLKANTVSLLLEPTFKNNATSATVQYYLPVTAAVTRGSSLVQTSQTTVSFHVQFSTQVSGFVTGVPLLVTGSAFGAHAHVSTAISGSGQNYIVSVYGMTRLGNVSLVVPAGVAWLVNHPNVFNSASVADSSNFVTWVAQPTVVVQRRGPLVQFGSSVLFNITFSQKIAFFTNLAIRVNNNDKTSGAQPSTVTVLTSPSHSSFFVVSVSGMKAYAGYITLDVPAAVAVVDGFSQVVNLPSNSSSDYWGRIVQWTAPNTTRWTLRVSGVTKAGVLTVSAPASSWHSAVYPHAPSPALSASATFVFQPTTVVNHTQDTQTGSQVMFIVIFSSPVIGFNNSAGVKLLTLSGTAKPTTASIVPRQGTNNMQYTVTVSGMKAAGSVNLDVRSGAAYLQQYPTVPNLASSTDSSNNGRSVTWVPSSQNLGCNTGDPCTTDQQCVQPNTGLSYECVCTPQGSANCTTPVLVLQNFALNSAIQLAVRIIAAIPIALSVLFLVFLVNYREWNIVKATSPLFTSLMLVMITIFSIGAVFYSFSPKVGETGVCNARVWLTCLPLVCVLGILFSKTHRVSRIFHARTILQRPITDAQLSQIVAMMVTVELVLLIWYSAAGLGVGVRSVGSQSAQGYWTFSCSMSETGKGNQYYLWFGLQAFYILSFLLWGLYLSIRSRNLPTAFNESSSIFVALLGIFFVGIVLVPLDFTVQSDLNATCLLRGVGQSFVASVLLLVLFVPKWYFIYNNKGNRHMMSNLNTSFQSQQQGSLVEGANANNDAERKIVQSPKNPKNKPKSPQPPQQQQQQQQVQMVKPQAKPGGKPQSPNPAQNDIIRPLPPAGTGAAGAAAAGGNSNRIRPAPVGPGGAHQQQLQQQQGAGVGIGLSPHVQQRSPLADARRVQYEQQAAAQKLGGQNGMKSSFAQDAAFGASAFETPRKHEDASPAAAASMAPPAYPANGIVVGAGAGAGVAAAQSNPARASGQWRFMQTDNNNLTRASLAMDEQGALRHPELMVSSDIVIATANAPGTVAAMPALAEESDNKHSSSSSGRNQPGAPPKAGAAGAAGAGAGDRDRTSGDNAQPISPRRDAWARDSRPTGDSVFSSARDHEEPAGAAWFAERHGFSQGVASTESASSEHNGPPPPAGVSRLQIRSAVSGAGVGAGAGAVAASAAGATAHHGQQAYHMPPSSAANDDGQRGDFKRGQTHAPLQQQPHPHQLPQHTQPSIQFTSVAAVTPSHATEVGVSVGEAPRAGYSLQG